jgi:hypothetical protein
MPELRKNHEQPKKEERTGTQSRKNWAPIRIWASLYSLNGIFEITRQNPTNHQPKKGDNDDNNHQKNRTTFWSLAWVFITFGSPVHISRFGRGKGGGPGSLLQRPFWGDFVTKLDRKK